MPPGSTHGCRARFRSLAGARGVWPAAAPPAVADAQPADPTDDWHGLVTAPFGSVLKDMPAALHEVLLFQDAAQGAGAAVEQDCYAMNGPNPSFAGQRLDEYTLCFRHDRLYRIEATLQLPAATAAQVLSRACGDWLKNPAAPGATDGACNGHEGSIEFSARLRVESDGRVPLSITLESGASSP